MEHVYLVGAEAVENAASRIRTATDHMIQAANTFDAAVERLAQILEQDRSERRAERSRKASDEV